jgi:hypothetical protein
MAKFVSDILDINPVTDERVMSNEDTLVKRLSLLVIVFKKPK